MIEFGAQGVEVEVAQQLIDAGNGSATVMASQPDDAPEVRDAVVEHLIDALDERRGLLTVIGQQVQPVAEGLGPLLRTHPLEMRDLRLDLGDPRGHAGVPGSR